MGDTKSRGSDNETKSVGEREKNIWRWTEKRQKEKNRKRQMYDIIVY